MCVCACVRVQSCPTLCNSMDCSLPGFSIHGIFQVRILEWVVIYFSRRFSRPRDWTHISWISCIGRQVLYQLSHQGSSMHCIIIPPLFFLTVEKKNKTKKWFFEKINKIGKTSARFTKKNSTQIKSEMKEMLQLMP